LPLTSDHLDLGFHRRRVFDSPILIFESASVASTLARLHELHISQSHEWPRGVDRRNNGVIEAPEGTVLLITQAPH